MTFCARTAAARTRDSRQFGASGRTRTCNLLIRLQTLLNTNASGTVLSRFDYTYDADGQIQTWTQQAGTVSTNTYTLQYDPVDQLLGAVLTPSTATNILKQFAYSYDNSANRIGELVNTNATGADYNNLNQLTNQVNNGFVLFSGSITS